MCFSRMKIPILIIIICSSFRSIPLGIMKETSPIVLYVEQTPRASVSSYILGYGLQAVKIYARYLYGLRGQN